MNVPLRHVTVDIDAKQGAGLPGGALMSTVEHIEVLASLGAHGDGMDLVVDIAFLEGKDVEDIPAESSLVVHDVHARNGRHVVATIHTTGPIMALFSTTEGCWLSRPTWLNHKSGLRVTISGTVSRSRSATAGAARWPMNSGLASLQNSKLPSWSKTMMRRG